MRLRRTHAVDAHRRARDARPSTRAEGAAQAFEERTAPVNWPRVCATNVRQLEKLGDVAALRGFLADVCVGDADDGFVEYEDAGPARTALGLNQLTAQHLLRGAARQPEALRVEDACRT